MQKHCLSVQTALETVEVTLNFLQHKEFENHFSWDFEPLRSPAFLLKDKHTTLGFTDFDTKIHSDCLQVVHFNDCIF